MIRGIDEEREDAKSGRDTELTLSAGMVLALGCGLFLLCCFCFGLGYTVGHRGETTAVGSTPSAGAKMSLQSSGVGAKPMAGAQTPARQPATVAVNAPEDPGATAARSSATAPLAADAGVAPVQSPAKAPLQAQVRPALPGLSAVSQPGHPASALQVQPALSQLQGWMVQIAAVSHTEDAEVLVNALKRRGYAIMVRRDVADNLLHVQTGPFENRSDANAARQKLLNDGYNAIVQP